MAIDTVGIRSPYLSEFVAKKIERECIRRQGIDLKTGEKMYEITTGSLEGSFDSRISVKIEKDPEPYAYIEGSVHKALLGHNVFGGPENYQDSVRWMINLVSNLIDYELPSFDDWKASRIDIAEIFELGSFEVVQEYIRGLGSAVYPRRKPFKYGLECLFFPGTTTTTKVYHKGPEFYTHDRKRLRNYWSDKEIYEIIEKANGILRVEIGIKSRKLKYDFGKLPQVNEIENSYLEAVYDVEVKKMLHEGKKEMDTVRQAKAVEQRLYENYSPQKACLLFGTWMKLSAFGEQEVKKSLSRVTLYRHKKALEEAGCSWLGTDIAVKDFYLVPADFKPIRSDSRRLLGQAVEVEEKLRRLTA